MLEICCGSLDDALEAAAGGADRVELCSCLFLGGLTPSSGSLIEAKRRLAIPVMFMARPRGGGFCYTQTEMAVIERDVEMAIAQGADGVVFGILTPDGRVDLSRTRRICQLIGSREAVFHRAFDVTPDPFRALEELIDLGLTRVLTSGQCHTVCEGLDLIKRLVDHAGDRIQVMPGGGGIRPVPVRGRDPEDGLPADSRRRVADRPRRLDARQALGQVSAAPCTPPNNSMTSRTAGVVADLAGR